MISENDVETGGWMGYSVKRWGGGAEPRLYHRHCERSEAIHAFFAWRDGLLRFARNDGDGQQLAFSQRDAPEL
jgi:hypothetical protein